jgi:hypothetical protein
MTTRPLARKSAGDVAKLRVKGEGNFKEENFIRRKFFVRVFSAGLKAPLPRTRSPGLPPGEDGEMNSPLRREARSRSLTPLANGANGFGMTTNPRVRQRWKSGNWRARRDLNPQPLGSKPSALSN